MAKDKTAAYEIIGNLILKLIVIVVVSIGWMMMVRALIDHPNYPLGIATAGTPFAVMGTIVKHLFPVKWK